MQGSGPKNKQKCSRNVCGSLLSLLMPCFASHLRAKCVYEIARKSTETDAHKTCGVIMKCAVIGITRKHTRTTASILSVNSSSVLFCGK
ncbi:hypothetical protein PF008_g31831 [Phytophthora fragariae]|uniref:Secreted protein n=1 Tax=Phytophthora fragariae TaxID=53985 RepID=A0A6G0Q1I0_9STRA|nr:hypothetical protein PF008_g31831 [Phytophthora fragariae]